MLGRIRPWVIRDVTDPAAAKPQLLVEHAALERVAHELGAGRDPELLHDVGPVRLDRAHREVELTRDLLVRVTEGEQTEDLVLALREGILGRDEPGAERWVDIALPGGHLPDGGDELGVRRLLEDIAAGPCRERLSHVGGVVLHRQDQHLRVGRLLEDRRSGLDSAPGRHDDVHEDHVGLLRAHLEHRRPGVARFADDLEVLLAVQEQLEPGADDGVVVDDHDANQRSGTSTATVVPRCGADSTDRRPPTSAIRSRIPSSPRPPTWSALGSNPRPSSSITTTTASPFLVSTTLTVRAFACLITFVSA